MVRSEDAFWTEVMLCPWSCILCTDSSPLCPGRCLQQEALRPSLPPRGKDPSLPEEPGSQGLGSRVSLWTPAHLAIVGCENICVTMCPVSSCFQRRAAWCHLSRHPRMEWPHRLHPGHLGGPGHQRAERFPSFCSGTPTHMTWGPL